MEPDGGVRALTELYTGTLLKVPDLVFMPRELEKEKPEIWVKRLDQYRVAYMKLLLGKRQKVESCDGGGGSPGCFDHACFCRWVVFRCVPRMNNITIGAVRKCPLSVGTRRMPEKNYIMQLKRTVVLV